MNKYIDFLILKNSFCEIHKISHSVDLTTQQLLEKIVIKHQIQHHMTVGEAMALNRLGSPATLHKKINDLWLAGLIQMNFKENNRRTKLLAPTDITHEYFRLMEDIFIKSFKNRTDDKYIINGINSI